MNNIYRANSHYIENRGENSPHKKEKIDFKKFKNNASSSLNDVEHFLCDIHNFWKYIKLYKILK